MEIFDLIFGFFNLINQFIQTIIDAIDGITLIFISLIEIIIRFVYLLPYPLYPCLIAFLGVYLTILIYKLVRKG